MESKMIMLVSNFPRKILKKSARTPVVMQLSLLFLWRHLVLNVSYERDPHFGRVIAAQHITHKVCLDLHLNLDFGSVIGPGTRDPATYHF